MQIEGISLAIELGKAPDRLAVETAPHTLVCQRQTRQNPRLGGLAPITLGKESTQVDFARVAANSFARRFGQSTRQLYDFHSQVVQAISPPMLQCISTGVGFLGAGVILRQSDPAERRLTVKGLTSASEIWVSAALGAGAGCGLWLSSSIGTALLVIILTVGKRIERMIPVRIDEELS